MVDAQRAVTGLGKAYHLPIDRLRLDAENPRLPESMHGRRQDDLAVDLALGFDALTVAESIASHGYFNSEPLIAIPDAVDGLYIVVEGNRRLAALVGLTDPVVRSQFADADKWEALALRANLDPQVLVPVVVAPDRRSVTPIIGFRHISGILQWQPYAQARYVAKLIDDDAMSTGDVAKMVGIDRTRVGNLYRDQAIATQAKALGIETGNLERSFSLLTVAMGTTVLRNHIGAPLGSAILPGEEPIVASKAKELEELLGWLFGHGAVPAVIGESRDIARLGNVVASPVGLQALRDGESLELAIQRVKDASDDPRGRLTKRLRAGKNSLEHALEDIADFADDPEVLELVASARAAVDGLLDAVENT